MHPSSKTAQQPQHSGNIALQWHRARSYATLFANRPGSVGKLRPSGPPGSLICEYIQNVQAQWQSFKLSYFRAAISFWALKMLSAGMAPRTEEVG